MCRFIFTLGYGWVVGGGGCLFFVPVVYLPSPPLLLGHYRLESIYQLRDFGDAAQ